MNVFTGTYFRKASEKLNVPENKLDQVLLFSLVGAPSVLERFACGKILYQLSSQSALKLRSKRQYRLGHPQSTIQPL